MVNVNVARMRAESSVLTQPNLRLAVLALALLGSSLTAKRWQVLAWDANPRGREKNDSKSREATAGVGIGGGDRTPVAPSGLSLLALSFTWDLHPRLAHAVPVGTKTKTIAPRFREQRSYKNLHVNCLVNITF